MTAVGVLVLVLAFLVSARSEVRARDPEVEQEEDGEDWGVGAGVVSATETPLLGDGGNYPARSGNWCAFVQKRVVSMAVACGTEKYTIKSQSPCPSGGPDCHLIMYKLSTRPLYRQKQKTFTALLWRCCPGQGGDNCDDTVAEAQPHSGSSALIGGPKSNSAPGVLQTAGVQQQQGDPNSEQNDHQGSVNTPYNATSPVHSPDQARHVLHQDHAQHPVHAEHQDHVQHSFHAKLDDHAQHPIPVQHQDRARYSTDVQYPVHAQHPISVQYPIHTQHEDHVQHPVNVQDPISVQNGGHIHQAANTHEQQENLFPGVDEAEVLTFPDVPSPLPLPHMMALLVSQLQPLLDGFNRSLEQLSRQVGALAHDVAQLKSSQQEAPEEEDEERLDAKMDQVVHQVGALQRQVDSQHTELERRLHSQHAMLLYNITAIKTDNDLKLKRQHKLMQVSLQAMNTTLAGLKLDQDQDQDQDQNQDPDKDQDSPLKGQQDLPPQVAQTSPAVWEAIERLDNMVVNNTVKVGGLMEDVEVTSGSVQQLKRDLKALGERINQTARTSQVQFMETGLEVEAAKVTVLSRVGELAGNLSQQGQRLQEMDVDVDYLYTVLYKHNSSGQCDCLHLRDAVASLERGVANVTELANDNRLALEEDKQGVVGQWGGASDWKPVVEAVQRGLQQVKESLASDQTRARSLDQLLTHLSSALEEATAEVSALKEADRKRTEEMKRLSGSFNSLLKDAIRHSDVLELLLGEEVLEFLEWPLQDQEAHSIPALKEQLRLLQEELQGHNLSLSSLLGNKPGGREEVPSADQPSSWLEGGVMAPKEHHLQGGDGSDLWKLERSVDELKLKMLRLQEEPCCLRTEEVALQREVARLKRGLEDHLRTFKSIFSNTDVLERSDATLELDRVWQLLSKKKQRGERHRTRRQSGDVLSQSQATVLLLAASPHRASHGVLTFNPFLNRGHFDPRRGTFTAPEDGVYVFTLTLDVRPRGARLGLRSSLGATTNLLLQQGAALQPATYFTQLRLRRGEELRLVLRGGEWAESAGNAFSVLLLGRDSLRAL